MRDIIKTASRDVYDPYKELLIAIIIQAIEDYRRDPRKQNLKHQRGVAENEWRKARDFLKYEFPDIYKIIKKS